MPMLTSLTSSDSHFGWVNSLEFLYEVTIYHSQDFLKARFFLLLWCRHTRLRKSQILENKKKPSKTTPSLRVTLFNDTVWCEKLKFSEKSHIWENLSVGGQESGHINLYVEISVNLSLKSKISGSGTVKLFLSRLPRVRSQAQLIFVTTRWMKFTFMFLLIALFM